MAKYLKETEINNFTAGNGIPKSGSPVDYKFCTKGRVGVFGAIYDASSADDNILVADTLVSKNVIPEQTFGNIYILSGPDGPVGSIRVLENSLPFYSQRYTDTTQLNVNPAVNYTRYSSSQANIINNGGGVTNWSLIRGTTYDYTLSATVSDVRNSSITYNTYYQIGTLSIGKSGGPTIGRNVYYMRKKLGGTPQPPTPRTGSPVFHFYGINYSSRAVTCYLYISIFKNTGSTEITLCSDYNIGNFSLPTNHTKQTFGTGTTTITSVVHEEGEHCRAVITARMVISNNSVAGEDFADGEYQFYVNPAPNQQPGWAITFCVDGGGTDIYHNMEYWT